MDYRTKEMIESVFKQLIAINDRLDEKALTQQDLEEEKENFEDALWAVQELNELLNLYRNTTKLDTRVERISLVKLRNALGNLGWYITHLSQQADVIFEHYPMPEEVRNQKRTYCCKLMKMALLSEDDPVEYDCVLRKYSIRCVNNIAVTEPIDYCPWCGHTLPKKLNAEFLAILKKEYGIEQNLLEVSVDKELPEEFKSDQWWIKRGL